MLTVWLTCTLVILVLDTDNTGSPLYCFDVQGSSPIDEGEKWPPETDDTVVWVCRASQTVDMLGNVNVLDGESENGVTDVGVRVPNRGRMDSGSEVVLYG